MGLYTYCGGACRRRLTVALAPQQTRDRTGVSEGGGMGGIAGQALTFTINRVMPGDNSYS